MIIGITGTYASGKDTVADYFKKQGFVYYSCSDIIREICRNQGLETTRENLINKGNQLRKENGNNYLACCILKRIKNNKQENVVVVSIRHPDEIKEFKKCSNFIMLLVDASMEIRYARTKIRQGRPEDRNTFEEFKNNEYKEKTGTKEGQQLDLVAKMSDYIIINNGTIEELYEKIEEFLNWSKNQKS